MEPTKFCEASWELKKPSSMTDEECGPLPVWRDGRMCISCWKAGLWERLRFLFTGRMWLWVFFGWTQPPVYMSVKSPFVKEGKSDV